MQRKQLKKGEVYWIEYNTNESKKDGRDYIGCGVYLGDKYILPQFMVVPEEINGTWFDSRYAKRLATKPEIKAFKQKFVNDLFNSHKSNINER